MEEGLNAVDHGDVKRMHSKRVGRELAMQYLFECDLSGTGFSAETWEQFNAQAAPEFNIDFDNRYGRKCRDYAEKLLQAVNANREKIDGTIGEHSRNWAPERISAVDRNIMRVALAEMFTMDDVPPVVSIDEAVAIARDYSDLHSCDFINGLLNAVMAELNRPAREARHE